MFPGASIWRQLDRLPATGRAPVGVRIPVTMPAPVVPPVFHFPSPRYSAVAFQQPGPPTDSQGDPLANLIPELLLGAARNTAPGRLITAFRAARKLTVISGNAFFDVPFYAAYLASSQLERKLYVAKSWILGVEPVPVGPERAASFYARTRFGYSTQAELNRLYAEGRQAAHFNQNRGIYVQLQVEATRAGQPHTLNFAPDAAVGSSADAAAQRLRVFERGLSDALASRLYYQQVGFRQWVIELAAAGVFTGRASGGWFPGEKGDP